MSSAQQAALSQNKLIGTKADGSTEIIATNVSITAASTEVTLPAPKHYKIIIKQHFMEIRLLHL